MIESTDRPAWTTTLWQGMGNGFEAFKHKIVRKRDSSAEIIKDFDWTADANAVKVQLGRN